MHKISISQKTLDEFFENIKAIFTNGKLEKKEKKKILFSSLARTCYNPNLVKYFYTYLILEAFSHGKKH